MKYEVLNTYEADVQTIDNPYHFEQHQLFNMALRINKKRRFLFVSKVLGKHLAVDPAIPLLMGHLLAYRFHEIRYGKSAEFARKIAMAIQKQQHLREILSESQALPLQQPAPTTVIGFAETATALGHGFFEKLAGDACYIHTTREDLVDRQPVVCFEEEHSHATSHRVYADESIFKRGTEIILVDDEMTTGKTNCNIIRQLHEKYPHLTTFTLVSILDFRTDAYKKMVEETAAELAITIHCVSLYTGEFNITEYDLLAVEQEQKQGAATQRIDVQNMEEQLPTSLQLQRSYHAENAIAAANYYRYSGRFKVTYAEQKHVGKDVAKIAAELRVQRSEGSCLVLGTGEFMYMPMSIATQMGEDVYFHATTRSPIYANEQSLIYNKFSFNSGELPGVKNFLYNISRDKYRDIFVIYERIMDQRAVEDLYMQLKPYAENLHFVTLGGVAIDL